MGAPVRPASNSTTQKTHCFVKSTSNDLTAVGITTCLPSELTSSLRIGEFPCRLLRTKNHHFASSVSLIFSDGLAIFSYLTDVTHPNDISIKIVGYENT